jgi:hypothetical protein
LPKFCRLGTERASGTLSSEEYGARTSELKAKLPLLPLVHNVSEVNILLLHIPKAGGSTVSGIIRRIGDHHGHCGVCVYSV